MIDKLRSRPCGEALTRALDAVIAGAPGSARRARPESGGRQVQGPGDESRQFLCKFVPGFDPDRRGRPVLHHAVIRIISRRITHVLHTTYSETVSLH